MALDDYGALIQSGQQLVPDVNKQMLQQAQIGGLRADAGLAQQQTAALQQKQTRAQMFQQDMQASDGSPTAVSHLIMKYPEFADELKKGWDVENSAAQQSDLTTSAEIYSAANSGNWELAKQLAHQRADAEKAAGHSDPTYDQALQAMDAAAAGDPSQQKAVLNLLGTHLAAVTGVEHFGTVYGALKGGYTLDAGAARYDDNGNLVAHSPFIKDADGNIRLWTDNGTPPAAAATPDATAPTTGGFDNAVATVFGNEGGYNPSDLNGSPTMRGINWKANAKQLTAMGFTPATFKNLTDDQAKQIYKTYWDQSGAENLPPNLQTPYFDVYIRSPQAAKDALAHSEGDPVTFMHLTDAYFQNLAKRDPNAAKYAKAWANRDKQNLAIATGNAPQDASAPAASGTDKFPVVIPGASPDQYRVLSPDEVKSKGLDPNQQYQLNSKTGQVTGLGQKTPDASDVLSRYGIANGETGPSVLAKLPANMASQVKALAEGRLPMPSSFALAKPYWQQMLQLTSQYDPSFDASSYPARKGAITAFTGMGKGAQVVGSVNRVANHLQLLWDENKKLAGPDLGWGPANSLAATVGQSFEPADAKAYDTAVGFVAGELEKIARNSPGTESGVDRVIQNLGRKNSAATRESAIKTAVGIISGAIDPLKDQYNSAFSNESTRPNIPWVTPKAQQIYSKIGGVDLSLTGAGAGSNTPVDTGSSPVRIQTAQQWQALKPGTHYIDPTGVARIKH